jgi:hypothetical protein
VCHGAQKGRIVQCILAGSRLDGAASHIAAPVYAGQKDKAEDAAVKEGLHLIRDAVVSYGLVAWRVGDGAFVVQPLY